MLKGKTAFITGTNRGIGKAILEEFAKNGANIIAHARKETDEFSQMILDVAQKYQVSITPVYFDLTDKEAMKAEVKAKIFDKAIPVNVLINSAGLAHGGLFQMTPVSKIREIFEVNFFAQLEVTQLLLRYMAKCGGGSIVFMSSVLGLDANVGECAYGTSKAALAFFAKTLAMETARLKIRVNALAPGLIETDMAGQMKDDFSKKMLENCALLRMGTVEEVAKTAAFLASDSASYLTGQVIRVDGGMR